MSNIRIVVSETINARPQAIYAVIADYHVGHQAILLKPYFRDMIIEKGGQGAGTELTIHMNVMGDKRTFHQIVEEPEPGRILVEKDVEKSQITQFTVDPLRDGQQTRVTISTEFEIRNGIAGWIEALMSRLFLRYLYRKELQNLAAYVANPETAYQTG